jgi:catechol 2,3-dioxygenase
MGTNALPAAADVGRLALRVADLEAAVAFYVDVLGLERLDVDRLDAASAAQPADGERAVLGVDGEALLALDGAPDAPRRGPTEAGLYHVAIRVPDRPTFGAVVASLQDRSLIDGAADHAVSEAIYLRDPEGNGLELYVDRPREDWPVADGRVAMVTDPLGLEELVALAPDAGESGNIAADDSPAPTLPGGTTIGHVHLEVTDLVATQAFYGETLGMNVRQRMGDQALFLAAGEYHHHVGANTWQRRSAPATGGSLGLAWFEVVVPDADALAAAVERFEAEGVAVERPAAGVAAVTDPDGIALRVRVDGSSGIRDDA